MFGIAVVVVVDHGSSTGAAVVFVVGDFSPFPVVDRCCFCDTRFLTSNWSRLRRTGLGRSRVKALINARVFIVS